MSFVVTWTRATRAQYLALWSGATDPDAVDAASSRIESELSTDAHLKGESRVDPVRILLDPPLAVLFVADVDVGVAYIVSVGWSGDPA